MSAARWGRTRNEMALFQKGSDELFGAVDDQLCPGVAQALLASVPPRHADGEHTRVDAGFDVYIRVADKGALLRRGSELRGDGKGGRGIFSKRMFEASTDKGAVT